MIEVAALTQGRLVPSSRYRVRQNIQNLKQYDINVSEYISPVNLSRAVPFNLSAWPRFARLPFVAAWQGLKISSRLPQVYKSRGYDVTWLQRPLLPGYVTLENFFDSPVVFDVDDALWLSRAGSKKSMSKIAKLSSTVVAGNQYIADWFSNYSEKVVIVPTGVDVKRFVPSKNIAKDRFTIGWVGTKSNLVYLQEIEQALNVFFKKYSDAELLVVSDGEPNLPNIPKKNIKVIKWSEASEIQCIQMMDVGLMPLPDNDWSKGKCSFKMLQYMACGIPVVVSPVGMNAEVLRLGEVGYAARNEHEWLDAFECLYNGGALSRAMGERGREVIISNFSTDKVSSKLAEIFESVV